MIFEGNLWQGLLQCTLIFHPSRKGVAKKRGWEKKLNENFSNKSKHDVVVAKRKMIHTGKPEKAFSEIWLSLKSQKCVLNRRNIKMPLPHIWCCLKIDAKKWNSMKKFTNDWLQQLSAKLALSNINWFLNHLQFLWIQRNFTQIFLFQYCATSAYYLSNFLSLLLTVISLSLALVEINKSGGEWSLSKKGLFTAPIFSSPSFRLQFSLL